MIELKRSEMKNDNIDRSIKHSFIETAKRPGRRALASLIWIYFWLLILEGPLRKWILPGVSNQLLLMRDPVVLAMYCVVFSAGWFRTNAIVVGFGIIGFIASLAAMLVGTEDIRVTAYGLDVNFLHIPVIFFIAESFDRERVLAVGKIIMLLSIPMAVLMIVQFRSDPYAFVNFGPGAVPGSQMAAALGKIRPPGLFTFIAGAAQFLTLASAFVLYGLLRKGTYRQPFVILCGLGLVISVAVSTSRLALGGIGVVLLMIGILGIYHQSVLRGVMGMVLPISFIFLIATNLDVFHEGTYVFHERLELAGDGAGGVATMASNWSERVLGDFLSGLRALKSAPLFGYGIGYGTNVAARLLTGHVGFLTDEREWGRVVSEMGPLLAVPYLFLRIAIVWRLFSQSRVSARIGNYLPMLLFGTCFLGILSGQFGVSFTMGFTVFNAGLCLAANNVNESEVPNQLGLHPEVVAGPAKRISRSCHAAALHAPAATSRIKPTKS